MTMLMDRLVLVLGLLCAGSAIANDRPGNIASLRDAVAAQDAVALDLACRDHGENVRADRPSHANWCGRTPGREVESGATRILRLASLRNGKGMAMSASAKDTPVATRVAADTGRSSGEMITPDVPGASQSCVGPRAGRWEAGVQLVLRNCRAADDKGFRRANGKVEAANGALCIASKGAKLVLTLTACDGAPAWTWSGSVTKSAPIRSADGRCWTVPKLDDPNAKFPFPVVAAPCAGAKPLGFFFSKD